MPGVAELVLQRRGSCFLDKANGIFVPPIRSETDALCCCSRAESCVDLRKPQIFRPLTSKQVWGLVGLDVRIESTMCRKTVIKDGG